MDGNPTSDEALPKVVYPVLVEGTQVAHLAITALDEYGADYRAICPGASLITSPLRLIAADEAFVWCSACREWADAAEVSLPRSP